MSLYVSEVNSIDWYWCCLAPRCLPCLQYVYHRSRDTGDGGLMNSLQISRQKGPNMLTHIRTDREVVVVLTDPAVVVQRKVLSQVPATV